MRMPQQLCCLKCSNMKVSGQFIAFRKVTHRVWPFELTVGLCSGFFLSMLLINCFLQSKFHPILVVEFFLLYIYACRLNHFVSYILSACRKKKILKFTYNVEEYTIGSGDIIDRFILLISPAISCFIKLAIL